MSPGRITTLLVASLLGACANLPTPTALPHEYPAPSSSAPLTIDPSPELNEPIDAAAAARLALRWHPSVRAAQSAFEVQQAQADQRMRLPNPAISLARARTRTTVDGGIETAWESEWGLHLPLGAWLAAWLGQSDRREIGVHAQAQAQAQWLMQVDMAARQARRAQIQAVAAQAVLADAESAWAAAQTAAALARRLNGVGNFSKLQWLRWEQAYAQQELMLAQAQELAQAARATLATQLGLWRTEEAAALRLPEALPALPENAPDAAGAVAPAETQALTDRLDFRAARERRLAMLAELGFVDAERWLKAFSAGLEGSTEREAADVARMRRIELAWELPLFDNGSARGQAARAQAQQAAWELQAAAQSVRAQVRAAQSALQHAWDRARHHQQRLLPLQQQISEEMLLRWNGMFEGPLEMLADAQARFAAQRATTEALRDYWLAWERAQQVRWSPPDASPASSPITSTPSGPKADAH